ncbi:MAG: hypothetical protein WDA04_02505 [Anaerolineaceae bacterium]
MYNRFLKQKDPRPGARDLSRGSTQIAPYEASHYADNGATVHLNRTTFQAHAGRWFWEVSFEPVYTLPVSLAKSDFLLFLR